MAEVTFEFEEVLDDLLVGVVVVEVKAVGLPRVRLPPGLDGLPLGLEGRAQVPHQRLVGQAQPGQAAFELGEPPRRAHHVHPRPPEGEVQAQVLGGGRGHFKHGGFPGHPQELVAGVVDGAGGFGAEEGR